MNLLHPIAFIRPPVILIMSPEVSYTDNLLQLSTTVSMNIGFFNDLKEGEVADITVPDFAPIINSQFVNYNKVRSSLNVCANTGEAVDDCLLSLLEKMQPQNKIEFAKMDFSKRRDHFSILFNKSDIIKKLPEFDSSAKRKAITKTFSHFVNFRNYYTHGTLIIKYQTDQYYIQYIDKARGIKKVCGIDRKILTSYIDTGIELKRLMRLISSSI